MQNKDDEVFHQKKEARKILGNGPTTEYNSVNNLCGYLQIPTDPANSINLFQQQMERLRMSNIINQEMHALCPYGTATFISHIMPTHNIPLQYTLAGTWPYAAVPIYQTFQNGNAQPCTMSPVSSLSSSSSGVSAITNMQNHLLRSNLITNHSCAIETNTSLRNSPVLLSAEYSSGIMVNGAGGDATNSLPADSNNVSTTLSQARFNELIRLALRGSEIAEKLAFTHRNRPCFKKIDSLCARMKQDLIRPDGVLPNINSQGIAWAVKDFIFVFTRVINAWIIIKGYVYNTPEGLNKVKSALSPDFQASFLAWQNSTMDFIENLIKSFVNLDNLVQSQRNVYQKSDNTSGTASHNDNLTTPSNSIKILQHGNNLEEESVDFLNTSEGKIIHNSLDKNYMYTMVEDSEGSQRQATANGTYFKTGTYTPIKKDIILPRENCAVASSNNLFTATANADFQQSIDARFNEFWAPTVDINLTSNVENTVSAADTDFMKVKENMALNWMDSGLHVLENHLKEFSANYNPNGFPQRLDKDFIQKLNTMINRLNTMKTADFFFKIQFTENYFPDFVAKHKDDFIDLRSIIFKCQIGGYQNIYEVVHDIRKIIFVGKDFVKVKSDTNLEKSIMDFEEEFNKLLCDPAFENLQFDHIKGNPKEIFNIHANN